MKDLADDRDKDWENVCVVGAYKDKHGEWIDVWYPPCSTTELIGMLMRAILMIDDRGKDET